MKQSKSLNSMNIKLGNRTNRTTFPADTWLNEIQIEKAICNGGKIDIGPCVVEIINPNLARATYEDGGYEEYSFIRQKWGVRKETFSAAYGDTQYSISVHDDVADAIEEYTRLLPLLTNLDSERLFGLLILEVWA